MRPRENPAVNGSGGPEIAIDPADVNFECGRAMVLVMDVSIISMSKITPAVHVTSFLPPQNPSTGIQLRSPQALSMARALTTLYALYAYARETAGPGAHEFIESKKAAEGHGFGHSAIY